MGLLDRFIGKKKDAEREQVSSTSTPQPDPSTTPEQEIRHEVKPSFGPPNLDVPSIGVAGGGLEVPGITAPASQGRLYDPYEGISAVAIGKKQPFKLPDRPEFLFEEEASVRRRGWAENLQFYTGLGYLSGGVIGVSAGALKCATVKPDIPLDTLKLKANRLLNSAGSLAKPYGNSCGIVGLYFASMESYIANQVDLPGMPDYANTVAAGALSGALFRAPRGPQQALAAAAAGSVGGACIAALRNFFPSL